VVDGADHRRQSVLVTGGTGFLGRHVVARLRHRGWQPVVALGLADYDLRAEDDIRRMYDERQPETVIHLAGVVGGIGANRERPGEFFYDNAIMGIQLIELGRRAGVKKFVCIGTVCAYPKFCTAPFREDDLWNGYPEETNAPYGIAKKALLVQLQAYRQQYGFNGIYLLPVNLYGPGDNFDPASSHVIPALIRRFLEARDRGDGEVVVWGTGNATREFLYVEDAAEGIALATESYNGAEPVNLGSGMEISIRELATMIAGIVGYTGRIAWNTSAPDGQPRRLLDTSRAAEGFGFRAQMPFREGLRRTVEWYLQRGRQAELKLGATTEGNRPS